MIFSKQVVKTIIGLFIGIALISHIVYVIASNNTLTSISFGQFIAKYNADLYIVIILLFLSTSLEIIKWKFVIDTQHIISWKQSAKSVMLGQAASFITPNRIGDYPARILSLTKKLSYGSISLSIMSASAQTLAVIICSELALWVLYYNHIDVIFKILLQINSIILIVLSFLYLKIEWFSNRFSKIKFLRKIRRYIKVMRVIPIKLYISTIVLSILKCLIYSLQLFLLLRSAMVYNNPMQLYMICIIYFWGMTIIPSIAYAELGIRNKWGLFLFSFMTLESWKIVIAITGLWLINIVIPALMGTLLFLLNKPNRKIYASSN
ncbi:MAG: hypothetical protein RIQ61_116 [Bacteroidota bacterium]|jgi:uncharacterized membrane protein YbhN (UPF0104 family)